MIKGYDGFFIGWSKKWPEGLKTFLPMVAMLLVGIFAGTAFSIATTQNDPGPGGFTGRKKVTGVVAMLPYPHLFIPPGEDYPDGHTMMLAGAGKRGVQVKSEMHDARMVEVTGILAKRGTLDMLQIGGAFRPSKEPVPTDLPQPQSLGRWRLAGEICDGKCYSGAMRPGNGIAHRACANLCLIAGVPPVFVSTDAVAGSEFFMMADKDGNPVTQKILDYTALMIDVEGEIEKRGDLMVFKIDTETIRVR